jgi:VanZ family protein
MEKLFKIVWYWFPPLILMGIIFYLSSRSTVQVAGAESLNFIFYKSIHVLVYSSLYFLWFRVFNSFSKKKLTLNQKLWYPLIISILYGITDEIHQTFVPHRTGKFRDVIIDGIGIFIMLQYTKYNLHRLRFLL